MPDSEDEQWSRISAESELRPDHGVVADVPAALITPLPDDEQTFDPIELNEVPLPAGADVAEAAPDSDVVPPIQVVPFRSGPSAEPGPDVIVASPFEVPVAEAPVDVEQVHEMITDVPVPDEDPHEVVADLPDAKARPEKTPWWRLMLGGGESRSERRSHTPEAAAPQPRPVPSTDADEPEA